MIQDNDARSVLEQFTTSMESARDKLNKEEQRLGTVSREGQSLKQSVRQLEEQRATHIAAIASLEVECARLDQLTARRLTQYQSVQSAIQSIQSKKTEAENELSTTTKRVDIAREGYVRKGLEVQAALLSVLEDFDPDRLRHQLDVRRQELTLMQAKLASMRSSTLLTATRGRDREDPRYPAALRALEDAQRTAAEEEQRRQLKSAELTQLRETLRGRIKSLREEGTALEQSNALLRDNIGRAVDGLGQCGGCGASLADSVPPLGTADGESGHA